jgi:hypothetical protein
MGLLAIYLDLIRRKSINPYQTSRLEGKTFLEGYDILRSCSDFSHLLLNEWEEINLFSKNNKKILSRTVKNKNNPNGPKKSGCFVPQMAYKPHLKHSLLTRVSIRPTHTQPFFTSKSNIFHP